MSVLASTPRPPLLIVGMVWLFFVGLPTTLVWSLWNRGLAWEEAQQTDRRKTLLEQELMAFSLELEPPSFIEERCSRIIRSVWEKDLQNGRRFELFSEAKGLSDLRHSIQSRLPFPVSAMIWHGPDTDDCWYDTDINWDTPFSKRGLLQMFAEVNGQNNRSRCTSSQPPAWLRQLGKLSDAQKQALFIGIVRGLFGDVVRAQLQPWQTVVLLSKKFGGGRIYAFYASFTAHDSPKAPVLGGCLLLVRERDLDPNRLMTEVTKKSFHVGTVRRGHFPKTGTSFVSKATRLPEFRADRNGEYLLARPKGWFQGFLSSRGTFQSKSAESDCYLEICLPAQFRRNPLRDWLPWLEISLQVCFSLGTAIFLHIAYFGFALPLKVRGKILLGVMLTGLFPMSLLILGLFLQHRLQLERTRETIFRRMQSHQQMAESLFRSYMIDLGQKLLGCTDNLRSASGSSASLRAALPRLFGHLPIREVYAVCEDQSEFSWSKSSLPSDDISSTEKKLLLATARALNLGIDPRSRERKPEIKFFGFTVNLWTIGDTLARPGVLLSTTLLGNKERILAGLPILMESGVATLLLRFAPEDLLEGFFRHHGSDLQSFQEKLGDWSVSLAAAKLEESRVDRISRVFWEPGKGGLKRFKHRLDTAVRLGLRVEEEVVSTSGTTRLLSTSVIPRFPCLFVTWAESTSRTSPVPLLLGAGVYLFFLLSFIVLLLEQVFRRPILFFATAAFEIEQGRYPAQPPVIGNDELGRLGHAFGEMVQGLRHRDELSHFVSDEVMTAVQAESEEGLKPGGELMTVTVLFACLRGFKSQTGQLEPSENLRFLNALLEKTDETLKDYGGSLDKMIEDTVMGVFRPRVNSEPSSVRAVKTAFAIQKKLAQVWQQDGISCDIGIAHGTVLSGRIGSRHGTLDYSVIGNAVNLAARLKVEAKKAYTTGVLIDPRTIQHARGAISIKFLERAPIKGRTRFFNLYEALGLRGDK